MRLLFTFLFCIIIDSFYCQEWEQLSSYNGVGRHHPITVASNNFGYMIAGQSATFSNNLDDVYRYDPNINEWTQIDPFPGTARGYGYGVYDDNIAFCGFGSDNFGYPTDWWRFDMNSEEWTQLASFPGEGRNHPAMVIESNKIFVGLGSNLSGNLDDWWEYDINLNSWTQLQSFIGLPRHHPYYFGIDNKIYVGFGHGDNVLSQLNIFNDFYVWDIEQNAWSQLNNFPGEGRVAGTQFSANGKGYILSGDGEDHINLDYGEFWEYNPSNDTWAELPPHPGGARWAPGTFIIDCHVYLTSGLIGETSSFPSDLYSYTINYECGCTDAAAFNFSELAINDDGSCCYIEGCTDENALNYLPEACFDNNSCISIDLGCTDPNYSDFDINANLEVFTGGPSDLSDYGTGGYHYNDAWDMVFSVSEDTFLSSIDVNAENSGTITVDLTSSNGTIINQLDFDINDGWNTLEIATLIPEGNNYLIGITGNNENIGLYRNDAVPTGVFPIQIADRITITSNTTDNPTSYYYYFYNWSIDESCTGTLSNSEMTASNILVYPNPTSNNLTIDLGDLNGVKTTIKLYDPSGKIVFEKKSPSTLMIDVSGFAKGMYSLEITTDEQVLRSQVIID